MRITERVRELCSETPGEPNYQLDQLMREAAERIKAGEIPEEMVLDVLGGPL